MQIKALIALCAAAVVVASPIEKRATTVAIPTFSVPPKPTSSVPPKPTLSVPTHSVPTHS
ncbi:hypothetical protein FRC15_002731, partial [Serendipita sp. 397]